MKKNFKVMALIVCAVLMTPVIGSAGAMTPLMTPMIGSPLMTPGMGLGNSSDSFFKEFRNDRFFVDDFKDDRFFRGFKNDRFDRGDFRDFKNDHDRDD